MTPIAPASKTRRNTPAAGRLMGILPCRGMRAAKIMRNLEVEDQGSPGTRLARQRVPQIRLTGGYPRARAVFRRDLGAGYPLRPNTGCQEVAGGSSNRFPSPRPCRKPPPPQHTL